MHYQDVLTFWFDELTPEQWFVKDQSVDELIKSRFSYFLTAASRVELFAWRESAAGALAEILVLDQFSRNVYRDKPAAFAQDPLALALAQEAIRRGLNQELTAEQRSFLYMPFMHSESRHIHEQAVELFSEPGLENNLKFELAHKEIIDRFDRYPHRNQILGRVSTAEEIEFLKQPGSSF
ncbi:DUF924 family protein [Nitrincola alkalilacustris]|uniref:DUF924 family protein n=1 Tax=Nitrincola alkalilacustris TaxID=1571224 RepID=UPI00124DF792|nr:DUF924 family protein [Nitrincola alkalilacustris]